MDNVRLHIRDWPGYGRTLVHLAAAASDSGFIDAIALKLAPQLRVVSVSSRTGVPYQVDMSDVVGVLRQFGFEAPILLGEQLRSITAVLVAAWYPKLIGGLVLANPLLEPGADDRIELRSLRDCPPDLARLKAAIRCPVIEAVSVDDVVAFASRLP